MKKVILSLVVVGLSVSSSCSAASDELSTAGSKQRNKVSYYQVRVKPALVKAKLKTKKVLKRKDVQIAIGTAAVIGSGVLAYHYVPSFRGFVDGSANRVANSDMGQKLGKFTKRSGKVVDGGLKYLSKKTGEGYSFVSDKVADSYKIVSDKVSGVYKIVSGKAADSYKIVSDKVSGVYKIASSKAADSYKIVSDKVASSTENLVSNVKSGFNFIGEKVESAGSEFVNLFNRAPVVVNPSEPLVEKVVNGTTVADAVKNTTKTLVNGTTKSLPIGSTTKTVANATKSVKSTKTLPAWASAAKSIKSTKTLPAWANAAKSASKTVVNSFTKSAV